MIDLVLRRRRSSDRGRSRVTRSVGRFEAMEPRVLLSGNGLVGVAALFGGFSTGFPQHTFTVTSVPQDPNNTGIVPSTAVTVVGNVVGPFNSAISAVHTTLEIDAIENGTTIGSVTWDVTTDPAGTITGPSYFGQDPNAQDEALFSVPFTLQSATLATQDVTFKITSNFGSLGVFQSDGTTPLTGTFVVDAAPTITAISQPTTPRNTPVSSVNVTFSKPINPTTFTTAALSLTNNGTPVTLGSEVTFTTTDNTTFTIGGLSGDTTANGSYVLTVNAADIQDPLGTAGTGSQSTSFVVNTTPPTITAISPITTPRTTPVSSVDVTFSEPIVATTFTTAALTLTNNGTPVTLGSEVTITTTDNTTFDVGGLSGDTAAAGSYVLTVDATGVKDLAGNTGTGSQSESFVVNIPPTITALSSVTTPRNTPVSSVNVTFSKPINPSTFTTAALTLTNNGTPVTLGSEVTFTTTDNTTFTIGGLSTDTTAQGSYVLTVNAADIQDPLGTAGTGSQSTSFVVDTTPPTINPLAPIPEGHVPVPSVDVTFSKAINPTTFTTADLALTKNGTVVTLGSNVTISTTNNTTFIVNGLTSYTTPPATTAPPDTYKLTVSPTGIMDEAGNAATGGSQSVTFVIAPGPFIASIGPAPAPSTAPLQSLDITFSDPVQPATFTTAALSLLNVNWAAYNPSTPPIPGTPVPLGPGVTITEINDTTFSVSGLQTATAAAGTYALSVDPSAVKDTDGDLFIGTQTYFFSVLPGNGVVGVAADFKQSPTTTNPHHVLITSIPQDPLNDGFVNSQNVTFDGQVWRPGLGDFTTTHMSLTINAYENDPTTGTPTVVGSVSWPDTDVPGPADFHQGGANQLNYAFFQIPVTLLSSSSTPQDVTFQVTVVPLPSGGPSGTVTWLDWQDALTTTDLHTLTATLTVDEGAPTITAISPITTPRNTPVSSVDVTFSKAIDAATFTTANLTLTRNGSAVTLGPEVTVTQVDATHFTVGGLASATTPTGSYVLTVNGAGITDLAGNAATGSQSVDFTVQSADTGPQVVSVQRFGFHAQPTSVVITFNQDLNPTSASNPNAYEILAPGTAGNVAVPIASATYDAATRTVTLVPAYRLYLYEEYLLVVQGTGSNAITDVNGVALDGKANGQPGSDYMAAFGPQDLAGPAPGTDPGSKASHFPDGQSALKLSRSEASQLKHWKAIIRSGNPLIVATVKRPNSLQTRRLTIRK